MAEDIQKLKNLMQINGQKSSFETVENIDYEQLVLDPDSIDSLNTQTLVSAKVLFDLVKKLGPFIGNNITYDFNNIDSSMWNYLIPTVAAVMRYFTDGSGRLSHLVTPQNIVYLPFNANDKFDTVTITTNYPSNPSRIYTVETYTKGISLSEGSISSVTPATYNATKPKVGDLIYVKYRKQTYANSSTNGIQSTSVFHRFYHVDDSNKLVNYTEISPNLIYYNVVNNKFYRLTKDISAENFDDDTFFTELTIGAGN